GVWFGKAHGSAPLPGDHLRQVFFLLGLRSVGLDEVRCSLGQERQYQKAKVMNEPLLGGYSYAIGKALAADFLGFAHGAPAAFAIEFVQPVEGLRNADPTVFQLAPFTV